MKFKYLIIGILLIGVIIFAGCVQKEVSVNEMPVCDFPRQVGGETTGVVEGEFPAFYEKGTHWYGDSIFVTADYSLTGVKILIYDTDKEAKNHFDNSNYYNSKECKLTGSEIDCMVDDGKSDNDRSCTLSGVQGRCVNIVNPAGGGIIEFEWIEGNQIKSIKRTDNKQLNLDMFEPFVEEYKNCVVKR